MNVPRTLVALSIDGDRLVAISAAITDRIRIKAWHTAQFPAELNVKDHGAVGRWLASELDQSGVGRGKLLISVPRGEVVLKRLRLPRGEPGELAGMVQLQMGRQLTMSHEGTAIDYVPIDGVEQAGAAAPSETVSVLAAALPGDRMAWYRGVVKAAGCRIERLGLRASGVATLLADLSQRHTGPLLGVSAGWSSVEFVVVEQGELVFVRAADFGMAGSGEGEQSFAHRASVEAKRTWMSYRVGEGSVEVEAVVVPGEGDLARELAQACGAALEMPWKLSPLPRAVEVDGRMPAAETLIAAPLMGLLAETLSGRPTLDFAHPRKPPDVAAQRRQRALAAMLGLILAGGAALTFASMDLERLDARVKRERDRAGQLRAQYAEMLKEDAKLNHMRRWVAADIDWLAHARYISDAMPDPKQAQLEQFSGRLGAEVKFIPRNGAYDSTGWQLSQAAGFTLEGKSKRRDVANELRNRLVESEIYDVKTKGADAPDGSFGFDLTTVRPTPEPDPAKPRAAIKSKDGGEQGPAVAMEGQP